MENILLGIGVLVTLQFSALFSGMEMAYISFDKTLLRKKTNGSKDKHPSRMQRILKVPSHFIIFVLIGNNFCLICLSSFTTILAQNLLVGQSDSFIETFVIVTLTPIIIIFGELIPKNFGYLHSKTICRKTDWLVSVLMRVFKPLIFFLDILSKVIIWPVSFFLNPSKSSVTRGEIREVFEQKYQTGDMTHSEKELIDHVFDLSQTTVQKLMVPISKVARIQVDDSPKKLKELARKTHFTRFLVYGKNDQEILGYVNIFDIFFDANEEGGINEHLRTPIFISNKTTLQKALEILRKEKEWFLFILGDKEEVVGTLTLKQLLRF